ncbi:MAG: phosphoglycerate kinase [Proteobacteria bacterium]|nr:phosphoglycerate kinase [Pseudomonadota bacterium]
MKSLQTVDLNGKKVLVRCDLDVLDENCEIKEHFRLSSSLRTLNYILDNGGFAYICGHIGKTQSPNEKFSTKKLKDFFSNNLKNNNYEILENLRFDEREESNNETFAKELSFGKDLFVNESFATSHRDHASITSITKFLPSYLGFHFEEEIENLKYVLDNNHKPLVVIIGGAKIESKKPTIDKFINIADFILVGGKLAFEKSLENTPKIILANDFVDNFDIGQESIKKFGEIIFQSKTIFWSGPLGKVEDEKYKNGSIQIADLISKSGAYSVVGGGDTLAFLENNNLTHKFSFVSVGGSALLEYLSSGTLIGLEAIKKVNG